MGYILPVTNYQYHDYRKRITKAKRNPFYIERLYKTILETQYEDISEEDGKRKLSFPTPAYPFGPEIGEDANDEKVIAAITGKGRNFSESI